MNAFDRELLEWVNQLARRSFPFDVAVTQLATSNLLKGVPFVAALLWMVSARAPEAERRRRREVAVATLAAAAAAIVAGRLLANALPFRLRPAQNPALALVPPYGDAELLLRGWSAFPSDHAMIFAALATGLLVLSRRLGLAAHLYALAFIGLPRIYLGLHHPTDVLAGAAVGAAVGWAATRPAVRARLAWPALRWAERHPASFQAAAFVAVLQIATMFSDARRLVQGAAFAARGPEAAELSAERGPASPAPAPAALVPAPREADAPVRAANAPEPGLADAAAGAAAPIQDPPEPGPVDPAAGAGPIHARAVAPPRLRGPSPLPATAAPPSRPRGPSPLPARYEVPAGALCDAGCEAAAAARAPLPVVP